MAPSQKMFDVFLFILIKRLSVLIYPLSFISNKGNLSIPLFEIYKSIEKKKTNPGGLQNKTEGNVSYIQGNYDTQRNEP